MQKSEILESQPGCGESVIDRIIGGEAAEGREVPWMCAILRSDNRWRGCGAALLSCNPPVIVTAAHCLEGVDDPGKLRVSCGGTNLSLSHPTAPDLGEARLQVLDIVRHPGYRDPAVSLSSKGLKVHRFIHDIAVLKVSTELPCSRGRLFPVCLPPSQPAQSVGAALLSGWGRTSWPNGKTSNTLKKIRLPLYPRGKCGQVCQLPLPGPLNIKVCDLSKSQLCAGGEKELGACQGDSGSALVVQTREGGPWVLHGITSWSRGCALEGHPTVFTEVAKYKDWIAQQYGLTAP